MTEGNMRRLRSDLVFRVNYQGQVFGVSLKAIKGRTVLVHSPVALQQDTRAVLNPAVQGEGADFSGLQLFGWVMRAHADRSLYELRCDKLLSSVGTERLTRFMSDVLCWSSVDLKLETDVPQEGMIYYCFEENRAIGQSTAGGDSSRESAPLLPLADERTGRTPRAALASKMPQVGGDGAGEFPGNGGSSTVVTQDGKVSVFGVTIGESEWEALGDIRFSGKGVSSSGGAAPSGSLQGSKDAPERPSTKDGVGGLLRRLADRLSGDDPT